MRIPKTTYVWIRVWIALFLLWTPGLLNLQASAQNPPPLPDAIGLAGAAVNLSQSVTVSVQEINELTISSDVLLTITSATPGNGPQAVTDGSATYSLTTNGSNKKIVGSLDTDFADGITLKSLLQAPGVGSSSEQVLSEVAIDLVTGFGQVTGTDLSISYTAEASIDVAPNGNGASRIVTLTLMDN
jgi:hypothetical protein